VGIPEFITGDMIKPGATVIDVGITRVADDTAKKGFRIKGDVHYASASEVAQCNYTCARRSRFNDHCCLIKKYDESLPRFIKFIINYFEPSYFLSSNGNVLLSTR
jgi:hypothetical protein